MIMQRGTTVAQTSYLDEHLEKSSADRRQMLGHTSFLHDGALGNRYNRTT